MPGRIFLARPLEEVALAIGATNGIEGEPVRWNIAPGQDIVVCTPERALKRMRWGIIPVGRRNARGRPVMETIVNARSETVFDKSAFDGVGRAVVPADGWYEWTGKTRRKQAWRITSSSGALLFFAAITDVWTGPGGVEVPQVAMVTCAPSGDVKDIHHRMGVLLDQSDIDIWLRGSEDAVHPLMRPFRDGGLVVAPADDVDWSAP